MQTQQHKYFFLSSVSEHQLFENKIYFEFLRDFHRHVH